MRTFVPDCTCWSLLLTALAIRLRYKPTYDKLRVLIINKNERKPLARTNGNESPIWIWNNSGDIQKILSPKPLNSYSTMVQRATVRLMLILQFILGLQSQSIDFTDAFSQADIPSGKTVLLRFPGISRVMEDKIMLF